MTRVYTNELRNIKIMENVRKITRKIRDLPTCKSTRIHTCKSTLIHTCKSTRVEHRQKSIHGHQWMVLNRLYVRIQSHNNYLLEGR